MNDQEIADIKALIIAAGLEDVIGVFASAIEIDPHIQRPNGEWWDGWSVLAALIKAAKDPLVHGTSSSET